MIERVTNNRIVFCIWNRIASESTHEHATLIFIACFIDLLQFVPLQLKYGDQYVYFIRRLTMAAILLSTSPLPLLFACIHALYYTLRMHSYAELELFYDIVMILVVVTKRYVRRRHGSQSKTRLYRCDLGYFLPFISLC